MTTFEEYQAAKTAYEAAKSAYEAAKVAYEIENGPTWQSELLAAANTESRKETLKLAFAAGGSEKICRKIAPATRIKRSQGHINIETRFGGLSRGKAWAKNKSTGAWADKTGGTVHLTVGKWLVGSSDGFSRKESPTVWKVEEVQVGEETWTIAS